MALMGAVSAVTHPRLNRSLGDVVMMVTMIMHVTLSLSS
jgi:hypothetical protein